MATIVTRAVKGSPLTHTEVDDNFTNLNTAKLETTGGTMTGDLSFGDNNKAIFGAGNDLQIYHDGSNSYISDQGTGNLKILGTSMNIQSAAGENYIEAVNNAHVKLFYDALPKIATTATGIDVTGTVVADGLTVGAANPLVSIIDNNETGSGNITFSDSVRETAKISAASGASANLQFNILGAEAMRIASSGSVGIGTTSPASTLHLQAAANADTTLTVTGGVAAGLGSNAIIKLIPDGTAGAGVINIDGSDGSDVFQIKQSNATRLTIDSSGNVGIGTSSPTAPLQVKANGTAIALQPTSDTDNSIILFRNAADTANAGAMYYDHTNDAMVFWTNGSAERMRIDSSGNVLVGTSTNRLGEKLHVLGGGIVTSSAENTNMGLFGTFGGSELLIGAFSNIPVVFRTNNAERLRIDSSGNVGIGTTSVSEPLHIKATRAIIRLEPTAVGGTTYNIRNGISGASEGGLSFYDVTNAATRLAIDSSGRFLVGCTAQPSSSVNGFGVLSTGILIGSVNSDKVAVFNRNTSDGEIVLFQKDGATVGSIGATAGSTYYTTYASGTTGSGIIGGDGNILLANKFGASTNGSVDLGASNARVRNLYLSGGVYLGGTGSANHLDDYEEGTWTPTLGGNTTYSIQSGRYVKVGRLVYAQGVISVTTLGTGSTTTLSGLPFAPINAGGGNMGGGIFYFAGLAVNVITPTTYLGNNLTSLSFKSRTSAGTDLNTSLAVFGNSARVDFSVTYETAS